MLRPFYLYVKCLDCDKTKETCAHILIPCERSFILVFWQEEWLVRRPPVPEILGQADYIGAKSPIFDLFSPVAPLP